MNLKLLTLNAHSLHGGEGEIARNMKELCSLLEKERPNIIALQEVNQRKDADYADLNHTEDYYRAATCVAPVPLKRDNFALELFWQMAGRGIPYHFTYLPIKLGYGVLDEGLAIFSMSPIRSSCGFYISRGDIYEDHNTRMALLVEIKECDLMICNIHTSRYDSEIDPFYDQWKRLSDRLPDNRRMFIMGDLNCPADVRGEGYDRVCESGYFDMYRLADLREGGKVTAEGGIDGWADGAAGARIDYILSNFYPKAKRITYTRVLDGERGAVVSDHYGVMVDFEGVEDELS